MDILSEFKSVQICKINGLILEKRQDLKKKYDQLMEKANSLQKQMNHCATLQGRTNEIIKIINTPMKAISLLALVSDDLSTTDLLSKKMADLTLEDVVGETDITVWVERRLEIIKKDRDSSNLLNYYQNRMAIKNIKLYDATLKAMYNRQNQRDVYRVAMDYLVSNDIVKKIFSVNDLIQDFRKYKEMKKVI